MRRCQLSSCSAPACLCPGANCLVTIRATLFGICPSSGWQSPKVDSLERMGLINRAYDISQDRPGLRLCCYWRLRCHIMQATSSICFPADPATNTGVVFLYCLVASLTVIPWRKARRESQAIKHFNNYWHARVLLLLVGGLWVVSTFMPAPLSLRRMCSTQAV